MILTINTAADWRYIRQRKQVKKGKDSIRENTNIIGHDYRVRDQVLTRTKSAYK